MNYRNCCITSSRFILNKILNYVIINQKSHTLNTSDDHSWCQTQFFNGAMHCDGDRSN